MNCRAHHRCLTIVGLLALSALGAAAKNAKVQVHVKPDQAYVFVDGTPMGSGSRGISVEAGKHTIGAYNYGFKPQVQEVSLSAGKNAAMHFRLTPVPGTVAGPWGRIQIEGASQAAIYLNGKTPEYVVAHGDEINNSGNLLNCCTQQLIVPAGVNQVMVVFPRGKKGKTWTASINVPPNKRVLVNVNNGRQKIKDWPESAGINSVNRFQAGAASATIAVAPVSGSINAEAAKINCGDSADVSWKTSETVDAAVVADTGTLKESELNGSVKVQPKQTTTYNLHASGPGGTVTSAATVDVNPVVQSSLNASPSEVRYRRIGDKVLEQGTSSLAWKASNANTVVIDPLGAVQPAGTQAFQIKPTQDSNGPVNEVHTYTLTAKNECGGSNTQTATVRVTGSIEPIPDVTLASVFFPTGWPTARHPDIGLVQSQQEALARAADGFKKYLEYDPDAKLTVVAHADKRDTNQRNQALSERRANVVKEYLVSVGIPDGKIETVANGDTQNLDVAAVTALHDANPNKLANNETTRQRVWAYNRRVDLQLLPKGEQSAQFYPGNAPEADFLASPSRPDEKQIVTLAGEKTKVPVDAPPNQ